MSCRHRRIATLIVMAVVPTTAMAVNNVITVERGKLRGSESAGVSATATATP
jgi:hypothetical protein